MLKLIEAKSSCDRALRTGKNNNNFFTVFGNWERCQTDKPVSSPPLSHHSEEKTERGIASKSDDTSSFTLALAMKMSPTKRLTMMVIIMIKVPSFISSGVHGSIMVIIIVMKLWTDLQLPLHNNA